MTSSSCLPQDTSFFELLDQTPNLDERDNRGKQHTLAVVLMGLVLALCAGRDGNLSSIHRHMTHHFAPLCRQLKAYNRRVVSRPQLPRLLAKVNGVIFARLLFERFGLRLTPVQTGWFATDGKELRGSIEKGHTRGEACVSLVAHATEQVVALAYYTGSKESERPTVRQLLAHTGLQTHKLSLDALHLIPLTVSAIHQAGGCYLVGLKTNQAQLYRCWVAHSTVRAADFAHLDPPQRGHGRLEQRSYGSFDMSRTHRATRWQQAGLCTLVRVLRIRQTLTGVELSREVSYFVSNIAVSDQSAADALFAAVRGHWRIETMHHRRDVTLAEDAFRSGQAAVSRLMSSLRTLILNVLRADQVKNMAAKLDEFADSFPALLQFMVLKRVL